MKKYHLHIREIMPVCPLTCFEIVHVHVGKGGTHNTTYYDFNINLPTGIHKRLTRPAVGGQRRAERERETFLLEICTVGSVGTPVLWAHSKSGTP